jgi:hypothetical protein
MLRAQALLSKGAAQIGILVPVIKELAVVTPLGLVVAVAGSAAAFLPHSGIRLDLSEEG